MIGKKEQSKCFFILFTVFIVLQGLLFSTESVKANSAPHAPIPLQIIFKNTTGEPYYVSFMANTTKEEALANSRNLQRQNTPEEYTAEQEKMKEIFLEYAQQENFYLWEYPQNCTKTNEYKFYEPKPEEVIVLVYFPESGVLLNSEKIKLQSNENTYIVNMGKQEGTTLALGQIAEVPKQIITFVFRMCFTIILELLIARLFGFRTKKAFKVLIITNVITQLFLNFVLVIFWAYPNVADWWIFFILVLEIAVVALEYFIYNKKLGDERKKNGRPIKIGAYVIIANGSSYFLGLFFSVLFSKWAYNILFFLL